ncbi:hypothetical protein Tco_0494099 [Tanacetum coccineum]
MVWKSLSLLQEDFESQLRLFLAYASIKIFMVVSKWSVKSGFFLLGRLNEEGQCVPVLDTKINNPSKGFTFHAMKRFFSDYTGASLDMKSTTGGFQFLRCRLISWQYKKQTVVVNSTTEAEYVAASSCCGQVL